MTTETLSLRSIRCLVFIETHPLLGLHCRVTTEILSLRRLRCLAFIETHPLLGLHCHVTTETLSLRRLRCLVFIETHPLWGLHCHVTTETLSTENDAGLGGLRCRQCLSAMNIIRLVTVFETDPVRSSSLYALQSRRHISDEGGGLNISPFVVETKKAN